MAPSFWESLIYGLVSGLSEFLPVSAQAHRLLLQRLLGFSDVSLLNFLTHIGALAAVLQASRTLLDRIQREKHLASVPKRRRKRQPDQMTLLDARLVKYAFFTSLLGVILYSFLRVPVSSYLVLACILIINGIVIFLPAHLPSGNKDSRSMSPLDSLLIGLGGALGMVPGISRIGMTTTVALARGADKQHALNWSLLLSIPALLCLLGLDIYGMITGGIGELGVVIILQSLLSAALSYCGAYLAIIFMRFLAVRVGFSGFAYYSWGAALFSFVLYMTV